MDADTSYRALTQLHPRHAQVLVARFVAQTPGGDGRAFADFATFYGVPDASAKVLLWRAVREFEAALRGDPVGPPLGFDDEVREAEALHAALERAGDAGTTVAALRALTTHAPVLRQRIRDAERAEVESPAYARETWLRRLAIVVVLALSAWFYWKADLTRWWRQTIEAPAETRP